MSLWETVLQAYLRATFFTGVCVDGAQFVSATFRGTFGPLVNLRIVGGIAVVLRVPFKHQVRVIRCSDLYSFGAYRAHDCACLPRTSSAARMRLVCTMLQTEDFTAAVARERQKVYLLTLRNPAVRSQGEQVCGAGMVHHQLIQRLSEKTGCCALHCKTQTRASVDLRVYV